MFNTQEETRQCYCCETEKGLRREEGGNIIAVNSLGTLEYMNTMEQS